MKTRNRQAHKKKMLQFNYRTLQQNSPRPTRKVTVNTTTMNDQSLSPKSKDDLLSLTKIVNLPSGPESHLQSKSIVNQMTSQISAAPHDKIRFQSWYKRNTSFIAQVSSGSLAKEGGLINSFGVINPTIQPQDLYPSQCSNYQRNIMIK